MDSLGTFPPYVSTRGLGHAVTGLLLAYVLLSCVVVGSDLAFFEVAGRVASGDAVAASEHPATVATVGWRRGGQTLLVLGIAGPFLCWLYLSRANLRAFGMRRMQYKRIWTVSGFFVPALNLIRPYQVVREVWQASDPESDDAFGWKYTEAPLLLSLWWGSLLGWGVLEAIALVIQTSGLGTAARFQATQPIATLADVAGAIGASFAFFVVSEITRAQREKWGHLVERYGTPI